MLLLKNTPEVDSHVSEFYNFTPLTNQGDEFPFIQLLNKVVLIVNTASKCGFTKQYKTLEKLYEKYHDRGLVIVAFPCNQFLHQEPGTRDDIREFCSFAYGVTFPLMQKVNVNGDHCDPVYAWLKSQKKGLFGLKHVMWNFEKFLVNKKGEVVKRHCSFVDPAKLEDDIVRLLDEDV
ncbi:unnamed protein product [Ambrosiozyma monospora]|uniref:Unnamed protein product n=1 Tax=Ambrosiozyma monospora TaxID=43982 RepID=A0ACB5U3E4_AMBMO|nr:unnamed protein product [Ambrosiozyma monospora]